jgi:transcription initiation factor TFIID TATA-box-binding protein
MPKDVLHFPRRKERLPTLCPRIEPVNVVATAELGQPVDLLKLADVDGFLFDQVIYHCAYLKDKRTKAKVSIFGTGKMISIGTKSFADSEHDLKYAAKRLSDLKVIRPTRISAKLRNIVATTQLGQNLDLESLAGTLPNVIYEPDQFPAAIYHAKDLEAASVLVFSNGKIVFAGLRTTQQLKMARKVAASLIMSADS